MDFIDPDWLYLLTVPFVLMPLLAVIGNAKRKKRLAMILGKNANSPEAVHLSRVKRFWRVVLLCSSVFFIIAACARPSFYAKLLPSEAKGRDLMVLCDVSRSMNAADIAPSRLRHARYLLQQLASRSKGDRFGLIPFAGEAYLSCPLTSDPVTFNEYVEDLSTDSVPAGGTNLEKAFQKALRAFEGSESRNRAIILMTDGEELQGEIRKVTAELAGKNIPVFAVGFGDPAKGAVIPREPGSTALVRDREGRIVTSKLNEKLLSSIAAATKGIYIRTTATDSGLPQLESAISALERRSGKNLKNKLPVEEFPKLLGAALAALLIYLLLSERKSAALLMALLPFLAWSAPLQQLPGENKKEMLPPAPPSVSQSPVEIYNRAREMQKNNREGFEEIYRKVISHKDSSPVLRAGSFLNLGVDRHNRSRTGTQKALRQLKQRRLQESLETLQSSLSLAESAEELYSASIESSGAPLKELAPNLALLDRERKSMEALKKKIEELLKQQQRAQSQTRSAADRNQNAPQDQQQRQQQQRSIDQAQKESSRLQQQAQQLDQKEMADAARKAAEELQKASQAKKEGKDRESSEHTEKAARALAGAAPEKKKESGREEKKNQSSQQQNQNQQQPSSGNPSPRPQLSPENRKGALQMLDLMGEDDKRLRSAIKKNMRMKRPQTEKDW